MGGRLEGGEEVGRADTGEEHSRQRNGQDRRAESKAEGRLQRLGWGCGPWRVSRATMYQLLHTESNEEPPQDVDLPFFKYAPHLA